MLNGIVALNRKLIRLTVTILTLGLAASAWAGEVTRDPRDLLGPLYDATSQFPGAPSHRPRPSLDSVRHWNEIAIDASGAGERRGHSYEGGQGWPGRRRPWAGGWITPGARSGGGDNKPLSARPRARWAHAGAGSTLPPGSRPTISVRGSPRHWTARS